MSDNWIVQNLQNALNTWNSKLADIWNLVTQTPETFKGGTIWNVIKNIDDVKKNALSEWSLKPGEAPPNSILKIIDTFHTATDFYEAKITDEKWFKTRFSDANPDEINQDFQEELTKITEEEKIEAELKAESFNTPVWTEEEYKRLSAIRDTHYENLISAAQPYTSDDLHKTQRTKALKIVREILFEDKYYCHIALYYCNLTFLSDHVNL